MTDFIFLILRGHSLQVLQTPVSMLVGFSFSLLFLFSLLISLPLGHLFQLFRPEFVKNHPIPLCSDAFSGFIQADPKVISPSFISLFPSSHFFCFRLSSYFPPLVPLPFLFSFFPSFPPLPNSLKQRKEYNEQVIAATSHLLSRVIPALVKSLERTTPPTKDGYTFLASRLCEEFHKVCFFLIFLIFFLVF